MIKILQKDFLDDNFIIKPLTSNININDKIIFNKNDIFYFGNYKNDKLDIIKNKINKNKKNIINAIEKGTKIIIHGNSIDIFNNNFKAKDINLFTAYNKKKKHIIIDNLKKGINTFNFRYKNLICFK